MKLTDRQLQNLLGLTSEPGPAKLGEAVAWGVFFGAVAWAVWALLWIACGPWACPGTVRL